VGGRWRALRQARGFAALHYIRPGHIHKKNQIPWKYANFSYQSPPETRPERSRPIS
jgi:hypothetical protein